MDFHQTFVNNASWDKEEVFSFGDQKIKGEGHSMTIYAKMFLGVSLFPQGRTVLSTG